MLKEKRTLSGKAKEKLKFQRLVKTSDVRIAPGKKEISKVVSTHLWNTPLNLYQQAISRDSFHSWPGELPGVRCNFLGRFEPNRSWVNHHGFRWPLNFRGVTAAGPEYVVSEKRQ